MGVEVVEIVGLAHDGGEQPARARRVPRQRLPRLRRRQFPARVGIQPPALNPVGGRGQDRLSLRQVELQRPLPLRARLVNDQAPSLQLRPRRALRPQQILPVFASLPPGEPGFQPKALVFNDRMAKKLPPFLAEIGRPSPVPLTVKITGIVPGPADALLLQLLQLPGDALLVQLPCLPEPGDEVAVVEGRLAETLQEGGVGRMVHFGRSQL